MQYLTGIASNVKIHSQESTTLTKEGAKINTKHICNFDINDEGFLYQSEKPATISDGDSLAIVYNGSRLGFKTKNRVKGMWNRSNNTHSGPIALPYFMLAITVIILYVFVIYLEIPDKMKASAMSIGFNDNLFEQLTLLISTLAVFLAVFSFTWGIKINAMIRRLKSLE